jgi:hypothetical protein
MSIEFYKVLHLLGIFLVILGLGGITLHVASGGTREFKGRKLAAMTHGIGLLLVFVAGFGMAGKLGLMHGMPPWLIAKMLIWLFLGLLPVLVYRRPQLGKLWWSSVFVLASLAAFLAIYKPGA